MAGLDQILLFFDPFPLHMSISDRLGPSSLSSALSSGLEGGCLTPDSSTRRRAPLMLPAMVLSTSARAMRSDSSLRMTLTELQRRSAPRPGGSLAAAARRSSFARSRFAAGFAGCSGFVTRVFGFAAHASFAFVSFPECPRRWVPGLKGAMSCGVSGSKQAAEKSPRRRKRSLSG